MQQETPASPKDFPFTMASNQAALEEKMGNIANYADMLGKVIMDDVIIHVGRLKEYLPTHLALPNGVIFVTNETTAKQEAVAMWCAANLAGRKMELLLDQIVPKLIAVFESEDAVRIYGGKLVLSEDWECVILRAQLKYLITESFFPYFYNSAPEIERAEANKLGSWPKRVWENDRWVNLRVNGVSVRGPFMRLRSPYLGLIVAPIGNTFVDPNNYDQGAVYGSVTFMGEPSRFRFTHPLVQLNQLFNGTRTFETFLKNVFTNRFPYIKYEDAFKNLVFDPETDPRQNTGAFASRTSGLKPVSWLRGNIKQTLIGTNMF